MVDHDHLVVYSGIVSNMVDHDHFVVYNCIVSNMVDHDHLVVYNGKVTKNSGECHYNRATLEYFFHIFSFL